MLSKNKIKIISDAICGVLMLLSILAFVLIGVFTNIWHPTWVILVIASILDGVISIIVVACVKVKKKDSESMGEEI